MSDTAAAALLFFLLLLFSIFSLIQQLSGVYIATSSWKCTNSEIVGTSPYRKEVCTQYTKENK